MSKIYEKTIVAGAAPPYNEKEILKVAKLDPATFRHFTLVNYQSSKSSLDNHRYAVPLTKKDGSKEVFYLSGRTVFAMMKSNYKSFDAAIQQYFLEYRDTPYFVP